MKTFTWVVVIALAFALYIGFLYIMIGAGIERSEKVECRQWESDSQKFEGWYSLSWQKAQCLNYNIELK